MDTSSSLTLSSIFLVLSCAALLIAAPQAEAARAFFVFGDSLVDNGNNDYLATTARADSPPYGIDYPTHRPTGRFSNGLNIPDLISTSYASYFLSFIFKLSCLFHRSSFCFWNLLFLLKLVLLVCLNK